MVRLSDAAFLNDRLTFRLDVLAVQAISANDEIFVEAIGLSIREVRVLRLIDDYPGITFMEVCNATGLERSLTSRIIKKLIGDKLVVRSNADDDARRYQLSTTAEGKKRRARSRTLSDNLEDVLMRPLSKPEVAQLKALLDRLALWVRSPEYQQVLTEKKHKSVSPGQGAARK